MTCLTASGFSLLETLEQRLQTDLSVSLLAEMESELLRLRNELSAAEWRAFCMEFPKRSGFGILRLGDLTLRRLSDPECAFPASVMDAVLVDSFQARLAMPYSPARLVNAWEYSLPASRSIRSRRAYFSQEIAEVVRTAVKPRILVMGAGEMREAADILCAAHLQTVEFVALEPDAERRERLRNKYCTQRMDRQQMKLKNCGWDDPAHCGGNTGEFDLIYSTAWLDAMDDRQLVSWLSAGVQMLKPGGRIVAANFTPGSRDAGWMEACWNWHPSYRSEEHLARLAMDLKHPEVRGHAVFRDESGASAYLEIHSL